MNILLIATALLNMYKVKWENYEFEIDLYDNVGEYFDLPEPFLYDENGNLVNSPYYIEKGVNRTSLSVVNSRHVKEFNIDYRVTYYLLNITKDQTITFSIKDNIAPVFLKLPEIRVPVKTKLLTEKELLSNVIVDDNYYETDKLVISVSDLLSVNINKVGIYKIKFEVFDPSNNLTTVVVDYEIFNNSPPEINYTDPIILNYGDEFNVYSFFKFIDNNDPNLLITFDISNVDFNKLGTYQLTVSAENNGNLKTTISTFITITDKEKPVLIIDNNINVFNVYEFDNSFLVNLITKVSDNYDKLTYKDVVIHSQVNPDILSKYKVIYELTDSSFNTVSKEITIEIKDLEKPKIEQIKELEIDVFSDNVYWKNYFNFYDNYDDENDLEIKFNDKNINLLKLNTYILEIEITDLSKNKTKNTFSVKVIDKEKPEVTQVNEIIITDFREKNITDYKNYFTIKDNYDDYSNVKIELLNNIDYQKTGEYEVSFIFSDSSNNKNNIETSVYILDILAPTINFSEKKIKIYLYDEEINPYGLINSYSDNYSKEENIILNINNNIQYDKIGSYYIEYILKDESLNETKEYVIVIVDQKYEKMISGIDLIKNKNEEIEDKEGITLSSDVIKYNRYPEKIDTSNEGRIEILHVVYNQRGQKEEFIQVITITQKNKLDLTKYKYIFVINVLSILTILYFVKSNNKEKDFFDKQD